MMGGRENAGVGRPRSTEIMSTLRAEDMGITTRARSPHSRRLAASPACYGETGGVSCLPKPQRKHSHVTYLGSPLSGLVRSKGLLWFLMGALFSFLVLRARGPSGTVEGMVAVDQPHRGRMFYNPGWTGGPITLAGTDARYKPQGQHIMLDVYESDAEYLNDMDEMTRVCKKLLLDAGMHILSSSSHQLAPQGVSITFTIEESHLTIHTWPEHRAALVDLFTCGKTMLLPILPKLAESFRTTEHKSKWSIHFRGENKVTDLQENVLKNRWGSKEVLYSGKSAVQQIDVWRNQLDGVSGPGTASTNLYLDGSLQSSTGDEHIYHESLIHPAMLAHPSGPASVAIVGGGDIAATREVLRHASIRSVNVIELDPAVSQVTRVHMRQLDNCTFGADRFRSCLDDPRVHVHNTDAVQFFKDRCSSGAEKFDVIFMDLLDPEAHPSVGRYLYSREHFESLQCALTPDGILIAQIGDAPSPEIAKRDRLGSKVELIAVMRGLFGEDTTFLYDVYVPSFRGEWSFVIGCQTAACAERFHASTADVDRALRERILPNAAPLRFFDGVVMANFQQPSIAWHTLL